MHMMDHTLRTVDILRRGYGRRYSGLPVDSLERDGFTIDCSTGYFRPDMFDLRIDDTVRWMHNGRWIEGRIVRVVRDDAVLRVSLEDVELLPPDFFPY